MALTLCGDQGSDIRRLCHVDTPPLTPPSFSLSHFSLLTLSLSLPIFVLSFVSDKQIEAYKRSVEKKKTKIPPISERPSYDYGTPVGGGRVGGVRAVANVGSSSSRARGEGESDQYDSHDRGRERDGERRVVKQGRVGGGRKAVPLYQRLAMQAKVEAERESKEKVSHSQPVS